MAAASPMVDLAAVCCPAPLVALSESPFCVAVMSERCQVEEGRQRPLRCSHAGETLPWLPASEQVKSDGEPATGWDDRRGHSTGPALRTLLGAEGRIRRSRGTGMLPLNTHARSCDG